MTGLRELFEEAADSPSQPSRLVADEVYAAGRRRRRRRLALATCSTAAALAAIAVAAVSLPAPAGPPVDELPIAGPTTPSEVVNPRPGQRIQWAGAADAKHLYLWFSTCTGAPCKTIVQLVGSDDGGRTWSDRGTPINIMGLTVLGPGTLIAAVPPSQPGAAPTTVMTSTDGGRHWAAAQRAGAVNAVPNGGTAMCWPQTAKPWCTMHAVDPVSHRISPLAEQPPLILNTDDLRIEESAGRLWVRGADRTTGRPAVAVSADAGRSWSTHVFADAPPCSREGCESPSLAVGAGGTAYAVTTGERDWAVYRTDSAGTGRAGWQRLTGADHVPYEPGTNGSFVTADGTHVLYQLADSRNSDTYRFWAARDGGAYQVVELDGLPGTAGPVRRTPDGWFYALSHADDDLYGSTDGWHWSPVTRR